MQTDPGQFDSSLDRDDLLEFLEVEPPSSEVADRSLLMREILPVAGGEIAFGMLLVLLILHFLLAWIGPDQNGQLFRDGLIVEAVSSSLLVVMPLLVIYAGIRSAMRDRDFFLPYVAIAGGGFISTLTLLGLYLAA